MFEDRAKAALELFEAVLELPESERLPWIERKCDGDESLAEDVRSLLAAHREANCFLDVTPVTLHTARVRGGDERSGNLAGQQIGDFLVERQIGAGGMGLVFLARQVSLKRQVALKVLPGHLHFSDSARARFGREVEAAARLQHHNIVAVYTTGEDAGTAYYAMEHIDGPSLSQVIEELRRRPLPELQSCPPVVSYLHQSGESTQALAGDITPPPNGAENDVDLSALALGGGYFQSIGCLMADVADALQYAHEAHVVHRDIKPSNLLLSHGGRIYISDFGIARLAEEPGLTRTGDVLGTPFYMAPEQISAAEGTVDERVDVYSLGATLYELLTLRPPFVGERREQVISKIIRDEPTPPRDVNRLVPRDVETICLKALEKQPARRYPSAGAMAKDLRLFAEGLPISARRTTAFAKSVRWTERNRLAAASILVTCALILAALFFAYRTHVAEARWTDAEFSRIYETAQLSALEGDLTRAKQAIGEAEKLGAPPAQIALLQGQLDFNAGKFQAACDQLESAVRDMPNSLAAHALLTSAYGANEQHEKQAQAAGKLSELKPSTLQDLLLIADAKSSSNFPEARDALDKAVSQYRTSVVARLTRGSVLVYRALETANADLAESAIEDLRIASELLEPNALLLGRMMQARLVAAAAYESTGDSKRRQLHLEQAALTAERLKSFPGQYQANLWRAAYFDYVGNEDEAVESWRAMKDHSITFLVLTLFRLEKYQEALDLCDERLAKYKRARFTEFFRAFILSAKSDSQKDVLAAFELQGKETLDPRNAHLFRYTIYCLAGDLEAAREFSRDLRGSSVRLSQDDESWRRILDYTCGDLDEAAMLKELSGSRTALCKAEFLIGMTQLATGDREDARLHFRACSNFKINRYVEDLMSRGLVAQLEREPDWPRWIPNSQNR